MIKALIFGVLIFGAMSAHAVILLAGEGDFLPVFRKNLALQTELNTCFQEMIKRHISVSQIPDLKLDSNISIYRCHIDDCFEVSFDSSLSTKRNFYSFKGTAYAVVDKLDEKGFAQHCSLYPRGEKKSITRDGKTCNVTSKDYLSINNSNGETVVNGCANVD